MPDVVNNNVAGDGPEITHDGQAAVTRTPAMFQEPNRGPTFQVGNKTVSQEELLELAKKGAEADARFASLQKNLEGAQQSAQVANYMRQIAETGDTGLFPKLAAELGLNAQEIAEAQRAMEDYMNRGGRRDDRRDDRGRPTRYSWDEEDEEDDPVEEWERRTNPNPGKPPQIDYSRLSPDLQRLMVKAEQSRIREIVENALDKDEVIGYYMRTAGDRGRDAVQKIISREIGHYLKDNPDFGDDGQDAMKQILPTVREIVENFAAPTTTGMSEFGAVPQTVGDLPRVPTKEPEYVPATSPDFERHVLERLQYNLHNERLAR